MEKNPSQKKKSTSYAFSVGRLRVIERRLMDRAAILRIADSSNITDALRVLEEAGYCDDLYWTSSIDAVLSKEYSRLFKLARELISDNDVLTVLFGKNDYHNAKIEIKSSYKSKGESGEFGNYDDFRLPGGILPEEILAIATAEAVAAFDKTVEPHIIDMIMDKAALETMVSAAKRIGDPFLLDYAAAFVDCANLSIVMRASSIFEGAFAKGGTLPIRDLEKSFETGERDMFKNTRYARIVFEDIKRFDKNRDDLIMKIVKAVKNESLTFRPIVAYVFGKEIEIRNVRLAFLCVGAGVSPETVKGGLRESYV